MHDFILKEIHNSDLKAELINIGFAGSNNLDVGSIVKVKNSFLYHPNVIQT